MLTIKRPNFTLARPDDKVRVVISSMPPLPNSSNKRYLTGTFAGRGEPVMVAFHNKATIDHVRMECGGSKFACEMPIKQAAFIAFNMLRMDMVVVYSVDKDGTWTVFYAKRGSNFFEHSI